ncbi:DUF4238 domain-containing protein [Microvirga lotononidis]|uniref:DUF4238 domain-containing protein n=1 Tax=Microvirga lotononidis TaxID=864069 RepID=I4YMP1_9HYPH|nr:DUF4238 domain-containing protein [Microvirga lotononidis]EIM25233.1 hypothetical protein MicloDRAFT_00059550 [Microvirga lotononidis]WQO29284.1 DUF4238 domain-containing protein [Microvirga lotononidis]
MSITRRHHYVPQCYLKAFAVPRKKTFQTIVFDARGRKTYPTNIKNVAVELDFNRIDVEGHEPDALEKALAGFEGMLGPALVRVLEAGNLKNIEDRAIILNFMCLIAIRNPRHRETYRDFRERISKAIMGIVLATPERYASQMRKAREAGYVSRTDVTYEAMKEFIDEGNYSVEVPTEHHVDIEFGAFDKVLETFFARKWIILRAAPDSGGFVTSDHPLRLAWSRPRSGRHPPGHGLLGTEVLFPLSPKLAIAGAFEFQEGRELVLSAESIASVNSAIISNAEWQVYARDTHFTFLSDYGEIPRKASRLLDDRIFKRPYGNAEGI